MYFYIFGLFSFQDKCEDAWDKLANLEEIRAKLELDLQDKTEALKIDMDQLELSHHSSSLSHKPDPVRVPNK
jgi:tektin-2